MTAIAQASTFTSTDNGVHGFLLKTVPWATMLGRWCTSGASIAVTTYKYIWGSMRDRGRSPWDHFHSNLSPFLNWLDQSFTSLAVWLPYVLDPRDHGPSLCSWAEFHPRIEHLPLYFHVSTYICYSASGRRILWAGVSTIAKVVQPWLWKGGVSAVGDQRLNDDRSMVWPYSMCSVTFNH